MVATVAGRRVQVGSPALLRDLPSALASGTDVAVPVLATVERLESEGRTAVVVIVDGDPVGVIGLADRLRPHAAATVARLRSVVGSAADAEVVLLSGDNQLAATRLAERVGIDRAVGGLLPEDKVTAVQELRAGGRRVLFVGDGVNDAPAMATADVGVAMGGIGSDVALQTADAVLVRDDLIALPAVVALSRRAHRLVKANLVIAATVIAGLVAWDLLGTLPLPLGVAGHEGSTVVVGLNGLRLLRRSVWARASSTPTS